MAYIQGLHCSRGFILSRSTMVHPTCRLHVPIRPFPPVPSKFPLFLRLYCLHVQTIHKRHNYCIPSVAHCFDVCLCSTSLLCCLSVGNWHLNSALGLKRQRALNSHRPHISFSNASFPNPPLTLIPHNWVYSLKRGVDSCTF